MRGDTFKILFNAFLDSSNWKPNFSKIALETGIPVSTVHDQYCSNIKKSVVLVNAVVRDQQTKNISIKELKQ